MCYKTAGGVKNTKIEPILLKLNSEKKALQE